MTLANNLDAICVNVNATSTYFLNAHEVRNTSSNTLLLCLAYMRVQLLGRISATTTVVETTDIYVEAQAHRLFC
jgi:hypothetical protein